MARERLRGQAFEDDEPSLRLDRGPRGAQFVTYIDTYDDFRTVDWLDIGSSDSAVWDVILHMYRDEQIDPVFVVIFTSFLMPGSIYYAPLANDVRGIGEGNTGLNPEIFDNTANRRLDGYVFMNDVPFWLSSPENTEQMAMLFNQEIGHRFGVFVRADLGEGETTELLGRDMVHWSYFVHTGGSPMEGNAWIDNGDGSFTTATPPNHLAFHSLDLYLMGLIPPDEAERTYLIREPRGGGVDCFGFLLRAASPPQFCGERTVMGERHDFGVEDIIAVEGSRDPAWPDAPSAFDVAFVLVAAPGDAQDADLLGGFDMLVRRAVAGFSEGTGHRAELIVMTDAEGDGCGCRVAGRPASGFPVGLILLAVLRRLRPR